MNSLQKKKWKQQEKLCDKSIKSNASKCPVSIPSCTKPSSHLTPVPNKHVLFLRPPQTQLAAQYNFIAMHNTQPGT